MDATATTLDEVRDVVAETLGLQDRAGSLDASTPLLGELPELDSLAVVELITALEDRFGFEADESEVTAEVFETLGSLAGFVEANRP
ncbi:MAG: acyl carrier protein [Kineosporiaceae bacterium]